MRGVLPRRDFCRQCLAVGAGLAAVARRGDALAAELQVSPKSFDVESVQRTTLRVPFRETPGRAMDRELPHWRYTEVFQVTLASGATGLGETLLYYTWGSSDDSDVRRVQGRNAVDLMWDDSLGAGLQMSLIDAVARTAGVPIHRLLGPQIHHRTPLSWWNIDMPPEDMASECQEAMSRGYMSYKTKGRPWFDLWAQVEAVSAAVPESFKLDLDFNDTLLTAERAIPVLKEIESDPRIDIYETPIPQSDVEGNRQITEATRVQVALHYGTPSPRVCVQRAVCDGFVIGGGASSILKQAAFADQVDMPFWLQLVGTGITAAFSLHFGAVMKQAVWPAVNCHQLYESDLLDRPGVEHGFATVPDQPGLGFGLDQEALERYRVEKPAARPEPQRLLESRWPDGRCLYIANTGQVNFMIRAAMDGVIPFFEKGVTTRRMPNDGSIAWKQRYQRARKQPYFASAE